MGPEEPRITEKERDNVEKGKKQDRKEKRLTEAWCRACQSAQQRTSGGHRGVRA